MILVFLSIREYLRDFFLNLFENFTMSSVITLLTGVVLGFLICIFAYFIFVLASFRKPKKQKSEALPEVSDTVILDKIKGAKNEYNINYANLQVNEKIGGLKDICVNLLKEIAKEYYPDSNYPVYELSMEELLTLATYISDRLNEILSGKVTKHFRKIRVSQIIHLLDIKKKASELKAVKAMNKLQLPKVSQTVMSAINVFNPVYWVKKVAIGTTMLVATNKLATTIIDIVGEETCKVYSKSVFNKETEIDTEVQNSIEELEKIVEGGN